MTDLFIRNTPLPPIRPAFLNYEPEQPFSGYADLLDFHPWESAKAGTELMIEQISYLTNLDWNLVYSFSMFIVLVLSFGYLVTRPFR